MDEELKDAQEKVVEADRLQRQGRPLSAALAATQGALRLAEYSDAIFPGSIEERTLETLRDDVEYLQAKVEESKKKQEKKEQKGDR